MKKYTYSNQDLLKPEKWSPKAAYITGFTVADGNITRGKYPVVQYSVKYSSKKILEYITEAFGYDGILYNYPQHGQFQGEDLAVLHLRNEEIVNGFMEMGIIPNKTYHQLSTFSVAKNRGFYRDFVRGYFDGDGCISRYKAACKNRPNAPDNVRVFFVCKVRNNLEVLGDILKEEIGIIPKIYQLDESWRLQYGGKECIALYDYMYYDCEEFYLEDKKEVFDKWLEYKGIKDTYISNCEQCGGRYVRMHPGNKVCKICRKKNKKDHKNHKI